MEHFPIFTQLHHRHVLVIGAGEVAYRKIDLLLKAGALVNVIANKLSKAVETLHTAGKITWLGSQFHDEDVNLAVLTIAATNDAKLNQQVYQAGLRYHRLVNVVDQQALCGFIVPSIVDRSPLQVAISTSGASPVLARRLREQLEAALPSHLADQATLARANRDVVKKALPNVADRRLFWEKLFDNPIFTQLISKQQLVAAEQLLRTNLIDQSTREKQGSVTLVGAGPGDAGLLTLKGLQAIQAADIVLYDALVGQGVLDLIRRDAKLLAVGKRAHAHSVAQETTNQLLIDYAKQGLRVVRLKGGDPFVFGRGAEEIEVLKAANIAYSIVPGVTAALGATAYAGIPLTHRDYAQSATFITGHCRAHGDDIQWDSLAKSRQTLAIYMGTIKANEISQSLIEHGKSAQTPVAIISQGTLPSQSVQLGTLQDLPQLAEQAQTPALIVIGEVVNLHRDLQWFGAD